MALLRRKRGSGQIFNFSDLIDLIKLLKPALKWKGRMQSWKEVAE
jgi:hypothetical protein